MILDQISKLTIESRELLDKLCLPSNLPDDFGLTKIIETHLSLLIIGQDYVWKFKKPLKLEFVDHSDIKRRWISAQAEIVLNRRLAPKIYLGLVPYSLRDFAPLPLLKDPPRSLPEEVGEVAVVMRTIPDRAMLSSLVESNSVDAILHITPLGHRLANFHRTLPALSSNDVLDAVSNFQHACLANFISISDLPPLETQLLKELESFSRTSWPEIREMLCKRGSRGYFVDGHGDLRCEHIVYTDNEVSAIDCLEFSSSLRVNDWMADIAFLKMDLEFQGRTDIWKALYKEYSSIMQDTSDELLYYFAIYRAMVRCKVELLSDSQGRNDAKHKERALRYLSLASRFRYKIEGPLVLVTCGVSGTGKSTLAAQLSKLLAAKHIESDRVRKCLFPEPEIHNVKFGQGKYTAASRQSVYDMMFQEVGKELRKEEIIIVDASFASRVNRIALKELAQASNADVYWLNCKLNLPELSRRLVSRRLNPNSTSSEGRIELIEHQAAAFESFDGSEGGKMIVVDTAKEVEVLADQILRSY